MKRYSTPSTAAEHRMYLPITYDELDAVVKDIAVFAGVKPIRLRNGASTDRARPYRDAIWKVLHTKYGFSHRDLAKVFGVSRTTVYDGLKACDGDSDRQSAIAVVIARMNRMGIGVF